MKTMYQIKEYVSDPYSIMCSDCQIDEIEIWSPISLEDLKEEHEIECAEEEYVKCLCKEQYEFMTNEKWIDTPKDFNEWIEQMIKNDMLRIVNK